MFVFSNLAMSLDGKIGTIERALTHLGSRADVAKMLRLRGSCDAVLIGASTLRSYGKPLRAPGRARQPWNVILSSNLRGLSPRLPFFADPALRRLLVVSRKGAARAYADHSEILVLTPGKLAARQILRKLARLGVRRLLVEGGGSVMWEFARANLIDEYHVTLTPQLIGGAQSPTLVDGAGFPPGRFLRLRLKSLKRSGSELFLIYARAVSPRYERVGRQPTTAVTTRGSTR